MKQLILVLSLFCLFPAWAEEQSLSGVIEAEQGGEKILFPLLKSDYSVDIQGDLAHVRLEQRFENPTGVPLNATYLFPLNQDAAVHAMRMQVGDEVIEARIRQLDEAKEAFAQAKQEGKSAAMLEQHRPNMFTQQLANLMPGLPIQVSLEYVQHLERIDGQYELVLPLVVGPRYQPAPAAQPEDMAMDGMTQPTLGQWQLESLPDYPKVMGLDLPKTIDDKRVGIEVRIDGGMSIGRIDSPTHAIGIEELSPTAKRVSLQEGRIVDNRDFVLRYQLAGQDVQAGMLQHQDSRGRFFSLLLEPPALPQSDHITPRELVFVLDTSGSMSGQPLQASKEFMRHSLRQLRPSDHFRVIDFSDSPREFSAQPLPATPENLQLGLRHVEGLSAGGGTRIDAAIQQALRVVPLENHLRILVFLTDGYIGNEQTVLQDINRLRGDARIYALGVGTAVNRYLLDEMARAGRGFVRYIDPTEEVETAARQFAERLQTPVLTHIQIDWGDTRVDQLTPAAIPDLFAGDSLRLLGKIEHLGQQPIKVSGLVNGQRATLPLQLQSVESKDPAAGQAIPQIWARSRIADRMREFSLPANQRPAGLSDEGIQQAVTQLGLDFSLMTRWTSLIAVSQKTYNHQIGQTQDANIPLPMVKGVTQLAYPQGGTQFGGSSAPEAEAGIPMLLLLLGLYYWRGRRVSGHYAP